MRKCFYRRHLCGAFSAFFCDSAGESLNGSFRPQAAIHVIYFEDMSNQTLIDRMEVALGCVRDGNMNGSEFAQVMRLNGGALEAMPYALIQDMRSIIGELDIAQWYDEDGCLPELNIVLIKAEAWLAKIPRKG